MDQDGRESNIDRDLMIRRIFDAAVGVPMDQRERFLHGACGGDEALETSLNQLLAGVEQEVQEIQASRFGHSLIGTALESHEGHWRLMELIGEGGAGIVFRAEWCGSSSIHQDHGGDAAIKILESRHGDGRVMDRFRAEVEMLRRLDHPGIVRAFDSNLGDGGALNSDLAWIAMELVPDSRWITDQTIGSNTTEANPAIDLLVEACDAIAQAHASGIVHRDLKPSNLLVGADERIRVIDFGIARLHPDLHRSGMHRTREGVMIGTPAYMAPEQVDSSLGPVTPRTDVYALGVVAFRLIAGRAPYEIGDNLLAAAQAVRHVPPLDLRRISPSTPESLVRVIERALSKEPRRRQSDASVLASEIRAAMSSRNASRSMRDRGRSKALLPLSVAIVLFGILVGVLFRSDRNVVQIVKPMLVSVPHDTPSIQEAIEMVGDGGRIVVQPGTYQECLVIESRSAFTLESAGGAEVTVIRPTSAEASVLRVGNGVDSRTKITGFTLSGGSTGSRSPGGFWVGGGVYLRNNAVHLADCVFDENRSAFGGNLYAMNFVGRIERCVFIRGQADADGGNAMFFRGQAEILDCDFLDGWTPGGGGGVKTVSGCNRFHGCRFIGNRGDRGGGIFHFNDGNEPSQLHVEESLIAGNQAFEGGGVWGRSTIDALNLDGTAIRSNQPDEVGGPLTLLLAHRDEGCWRDLDADGVVDQRDIEVLLEHFDANTSIQEGVFDLDGDGSINHRDLAIIIDGWGRCRL
jgi:serine/threonine protein kinase